MTDPSKNVATAFSRNNSNASVYNRNLQGFNLRQANPGRTYREASLNPLRSINNNVAYLGTNASKNLSSAIAGRAFDSQIVAALNFTDLRKYGNSNFGALLTGYPFPPNSPYFPYLSPSAYYRYNVPYSAVNYYTGSPCVGGSIGAGPYGQYGAYAQFGPYGAYEVPPGQLSPYGQFGVVPSPYGIAPGPCGVVPGAVAAAAVAAAPCAEFTNCALNYPNVDDCRACVISRYGSGFCADRICGR